MSLRLYVFAERFNLSRLKEDIIPNLISCCDCSDVVDDPDTLCAFLEALIPSFNYAFDHIPRPASGTLPTVLKVLTDCIGFNFEKFRAAPQFRQWVLDRPDIAYDIMCGLNKRRTPPNILTYRQPPHPLLRRCLNCNQVNIAVVICDACGALCKGEIAFVSGDREKWVARIPKAGQKTVLASRDRIIIYETDKATTELCCGVRTGLGDPKRPYTFHRNLSCGNLKCKFKAGADDEEFCYPD